MTTRSQIRPVWRAAFLLALVSACSDSDSNVGDTDPLVYDTGTNLADGNDTLATAQAIKVDLTATSGEDVDLLGELENAYILPQSDTDPDVDVYKVYLEAGVAYQLWATTAVPSNDGESRIEGDDEPNVRCDTYLRLYGPGDASSHQQSYLGDPGSALAESDDLPFRMQQGDPGMIFIPEITGEHYVEVLGYDQAVSEEDLAELEAELGSSYTIGGWDCQYRLMGRVRSTTEVECNDEYTLDDVAQIHEQMFDEPAFVSDCETIPYEDVLADQPFSTSSFHDSYEEFPGQIDFDEDADMWRFSFCGLPEVDISSDWYDDDDNALTTSRLNPAFLWTWSTWPVQVADNVATREVSLTLYNAQMQKVAYTESPEPEGNAGIADDAGIIYPVLNGETYFLKVAPLDQGSMYDEWDGFDTDTQSSPTDTSDSGTSDSGTEDSGTSDSGTSDSGSQDSGTSDSGSSDSGSNDSGSSDSGSSDSGSSDSGDTATGGWQPGELGIGDPSFYAGISRGYGQQLLYCGEENDDGEIEYSYRVWHELEGAYTTRFDNARSWNAEFGYWESLFPSDDNDGQSGVSRDVTEGESLEFCKVPGTSSYISRLVGTFKDVRSLYTRLDPDIAETAAAAGELPVDDDGETIDVWSDCGAGGQVCPDGDLYLINKSTNLGLSLKNKRITITVQSRSVGSPAIAEMYLFTSSIEDYPSYFANTEDQDIPSWALQPVVLSEPIYEEGVVTGYDTYRDPTISFETGSESLKYYLLVQPKPNAALDEYVMNPTTEELELSQMGFYLSGGITRDYASDADYYYLTVVIEDAE